MTLSCFSLLCLYVPWCAIFFNVVFYTHMQKARSLGDLRRLARDLYRPDNNNTSCSRKPIHTGVSVKALVSFFSPQYFNMYVYLVLHMNMYDLNLSTIFKPKWINLKICIQHPHKS